RIHDNFLFFIVHSIATLIRPAHNIAKNAIGADEHISSAFYLCATFILWSDVINIILLSIFISRLLIKIVAGADTAYFPNCIFAGTLAGMLKKVFIFNYILTTLSLFL